MRVIVFSLALASCLVAGCQPVMYLPSPLATAPTEGVEVGIGASVAPLQASGRVAAALPKGLGVYVQGVGANSWGADNLERYAGHTFEAGLVGRVALSEQTDGTGSVSYGSGRTQSYRFGSGSASVEGRVRRQSLSVGLARTLNAPSGLLRPEASLRLTHVQLSDLQQGRSGEPLENASALFAEPMVRLRLTTKVFYLEQQVGLSLLTSPSYQDDFDFFPVFAETYLGVNLTRLFRR